jgi:hypothetical protein
MLAASPRRRLSLLLSVSLTLGTIGVAHAQKEEPKPPGAGAEDNEAPPRRTTPISRSGEPASSVQAVEPASTKKFAPLDWRDAIGVYARYIFVTELMLKPYLAASTPLNSFAVGLQYIRRFAKFDVVTSLDFSWLAMPDGNWLAQSNVDTAALDTKFTQFDKLSFLSADVAIIGHYAFNDWLELRGGAGLGLGVVFGNVYTTNNSNQVCNKDNAGDTSKCYPISPTVGPIMLNQPDTNTKLKATEDSLHEDTAQNPHRKNSFKPPVMAVVNIMMALNFRLHRHVSTQIEIGFRDAMFVGAGLHYHF